MKNQPLNKKLINIQILIPFAEIFSKLISLVNIYLLMEVLLLSDYADYSYIIAIVLWASVLMDGGINNLVFNKSLKDDLKDINVLFSARFLLSSLIILVLALFFYFSKPAIVLPAIIYAIVVYFSSTSAFVKMLARGKEYHKIDLIVILSEPILKLLLFGFLYLFYNNNWELWMLMSVYLLASILAFIINYSFLSKFHQLSFFTGKFKALYTNLKATLQASKYYLLYYFIYIGLTRIDVIFIEEYSSKTVLAQFSVAIMLYGVMQLFFLTIITSKFKIVFNNEKKAITIIIIMLLSVVFATNILSSYVYKFLPHPQDYQGGNLILNSIIWAIIPSVLNFYYTAKLNFEHKTQLNAIIMFLPLLIKIIVYRFYQTQEIVVYQNTYVISEYFLLVCFLLYFTFRKKEMANNH